MQIGVDDNDINAPKNFKGDVEGKAATVADVVSETSLSPYSEVFGLQRFRETELIHGRWAMLGVLGALVAEGVTGQTWWVGGGRGGAGFGGGGPWRAAAGPDCVAGPPSGASAVGALDCEQARRRRKRQQRDGRHPPGRRAPARRLDAAKAELVSAPQFFNNELPWSINTAAVLNSLLMGGAEFYRNSQLDPEKRCYPGGFFDPLNFADDSNPERAFQLKTAEIKHGRLAMVAALGFAVQAASQGEGALGSLSKFGSTF
jgi:hypothetical protein